MMSVDIGIAGKSILNTTSVFSKLIKNVTIYYNVIFCNVLL